VYPGPYQALTTSRTGTRCGPLEPEGHRHDDTPEPRDRRADPNPGDWLLAGNEEPELGAHLVTPRLGYAHHGVYVGGGAVVHYAAFAKFWRRGPVEEISLRRFAHRHSLWVRPPRPTRLPSVEIVRRARSRLGENRYRFFSNNCEHLTEWCVNGEHRSLQVERLQSRLRRLSRTLENCVRWFSSAPRGGRDFRYARPG